MVFRMIISLLFAAALSTYPPLDENYMQRDCANATTVDGPCRLRRDIGVQDAQRRADAGETARLDGPDAISFVTQAEAESVEFAGALQYPMARIAGTNLWHLTLRIPRADEAILSYLFVPTPQPKDVSIVWHAWRGRLAPAEVEAVDQLARPLKKQLFESRHLGGSREVLVYEPPGTTPLAGVLYCADGRGLESFAKRVEPRVLDGSLPRVLLVGIASNADSKGRIGEYLFGVSDTDAKFITHERFFLEEVVPWVESQYKLPNDRMARATFGTSNGAAWALDTVLRHADRFGRAIAFSIAGRKATLETAPCPPVGIYLLAGTLEEMFHQRASEWAMLLEKKVVAHELHERVAAHDPKMWGDRLPDALAWAFGGRMKRDR